MRRWVHRKRWKKNCNAEKAENTGDAEEKDKRGNHGRHWRRGRAMKQNKGRT